MSLTISGKLVTPTGQAASNALIRFNAVTSKENNELEVIHGSSSTARCDADGAYSIALEYCRYELATRISTPDFIIHGQVTIDSDTQAKDLEDLIALIGLPGALSDELIKEFEKIKNEAEAARDGAIAAKEISETARDESVAAKDESVAAKDEAIEVMANVKDDAAAVAQDRSIVEQKALEVSNNTEQVAQDTMEVSTNTEQVRQDAIQVDSDKTTATNAASSATASELKSEKWADETKDVPVEPDKFSAKHWAEWAQYYANQVFISGGTFTPTAADEYPDISSTERDTLWIVEFPNPEDTYTFTAGQLVGETVNNGYMMLWDTPQDKWALIKTTISGIISINGKTGPSVTINYSDVGALSASATINGKLLSTNPALNYEDVGALSASATINGKLLSTNPALNYEDVGAISTSAISDSTTSESSITVASSLSIKITKDVADYAKSAVPALLFDKSIANIVAFNAIGLTVSASCKIKVAVSDDLLLFNEGSDVLLPELTPGTDYAIYATPDGLVSSNNFSYPDGYTEINSRMIGGFHYQDGFINEHSIWDLKFRPKASDPRGMVLVVGRAFWADIYLLNTTPDLLGTSAYNVQIADGSSPPKKPIAWGGDGSEQYTTLSQYIATEVLAAYGKRLPSYNEFQVLAMGSKAGYAVGTDPVKTKFDVNARSIIGCEQVSGHMWQWGSECWDRGNGLSGYDWQSVDTDGEGKVYASGSNGVGASLFGADWGDAGNTGSRASHWDSEPWSTSYTVAARGVCDHFELL